MDDLMFSLQKCDPRQLGGFDVVDSARSTLRSSCPHCVSNLWTHVVYSILRLFQLSLGVLGNNIICLLLARLIGSVFLVGHFILVIVFI